MGSTKVGDFDLEETTALPLLLAPNVGGKPNSDVLRPFRNGSDIVRADSKRWVIDYGVTTPLEVAVRYEGPMLHLEKFVRPFRERNNRAHYRERWWIHAEPRPGFRSATSQLPRYLGTARVAKHRLFVWLDSVILPDSKVIALAFAGDFHFGVLQSRLHEVWTLATCAWHGIGNDATYNPTECFETFPFPFPDDLTPPIEPPVMAKATKTPQPDRTYAENLAAHNYYIGKEGSPAYRSTPQTPADHRAAIAAAAKELNELRERWLNPPEWTETRMLEFPGSINGPWGRYVDPATLNAQTGVGTVRYPRLEPKDAECAAKLKKRTLTNLYNQRPAWLANAHKTLDAAVATAYGWPADLTDEQVLERLLALNLERAAEEAKTVKSSKPSKKTQRGKGEGEML